MEQKSPKSGGKDARAARLAAALKANLRRRKAQARARAEAKSSSEGGETEGDGADAPLAGTAQKGD